MNYYSTRDLKKTNPVSFSDAVVKGLADDGGLFMPESIPTLPTSFFENIESFSNEEIALKVAQSFIGDEIPTEDLKKIVNETINFLLPLKKVEDSIYCLELFHGPTLAFKDVGARFMARVMSYFIKKENKKVKVIVATSGDTGSAVAAGFYQVQDLEVYIIYPTGKVSPLQEKQLTTWGNNIHAIELDGTFDDCQKLAKQLLADKQLANEQLITSANSINIARLIPQSFYYFFSYAALKKLKLPIIISVPSGNFGNLTAGLLAKKMGLPIAHFIASTNANDVFPNYLNSGVYQSKASVATISNAMDVGNPSNFERMSYLFQEDLSNFKKEISSYSFTDAETETTVKQVYNNHHYLIDPHGAVAYLGLKKYLDNESSKYVGVFLETAHPAKFKEVMNTILKEEIELPERLAAYADKEKKSKLCINNYQDIKQLILEKWSD